MKSNLSTVEKIQFHGDTIEVARIGNKGYAHLKAMCDSLGIDHDTQRRKLKGVSWGRTVIMTVRDEIGRPHRLTMLELDAVPMWLATIHPSKVAFAVRAKLEAYQLEAALVLAAWFNGPAIERLGRLEALDRELSGLRAIVAELEIRNENAAVFMHFERRQRLAMASRVEEAERRVKLAEDRLDSVMMPSSRGHGDYMTLGDYHDKWPIMDAMGRRLGRKKMSAAGLSIAAYCRSRGSAVFKVKDPARGLVNSYPIGMLQSWRADHDHRTTVSSESYAKFHQPRLFA